MIVILTIHKNDYKESVSEFYNIGTVKSQVLTYILCITCTLLELGFAVFSVQLLILHRWLAKNNLTTHDYIRYLREKKANPNSTITIQEIANEFTSRIVRPINNRIFTGLYPCNRLDIHPINDQNVTISTNIILDDPIKNRCCNCCGVNKNDVKIIINSPMTTNTQQKKIDDVSNIGIFTEMKQIEEGKSGMMALNLQLNKSKNLNLVPQREIKRMNRSKTAENDKSREVTMISSSGYEKYKTIFQRTPDNI